MRYFNSVAATKFLGAAMPGLMFTMVAVSGISGSAQDGTTTQEGSEQKSRFTESSAIMIQAQSGSDGKPMVMSFSGVDSSGNGMAFSTEMGPGLAIGGFASADPFSMLSNSQIQEELELVGEQREQYDELQKSYNERLRKQLDNLKKGTPEAAKGLKESIQEMEAQKRKDIEGILLPRQLERLQQISFQQKLKNGGPANALSSKEMMESLGLNEDDLKKIKDKADELNKEMEEKLAKMRAEMQKELLGLLTAEQREKLEKMRGDDFDYKPAGPPFKLGGRREK